MVKPIQIKSLFLLFFLCFCTSISAQNTAKDIPLINILKKVERQFELSFSYNKKELKNIRCSAPENNATLEQVLAQISGKCEVQFYRIDERYIAVRPGKDALISICGTLIETATGAPLSNASILAENVQTTTDSGGVFRISAISESANISIYHQGFKVKEMLAGELNKPNECPLVFIDQKFNYLPTILLNSYLTKGISKNAEGSVSISNNNFEILPSLIDPDVLKIAQILPGIESFNETASDMNVRGGKNDEVLLL
ncbi:MAG: hypothetical protein DWP94_06660, partial [Flavobacterium sp.]